VSSQIALDSAGREHMFLTFFVSGADADAAEASSGGLTERINALGEMSWDEFAASARARAEGAWASVQTTARYLVGKPAALIAPTPSAEAEAAKQEEVKGAWSLVGLFSSLRTTKSGDAAASGTSGQVFKEGEVHAELIRVRHHLFLLPTTCL
jgi:import inner membrane translocase subunit TIM21